METVPGRQPSKNGHARRMFSAFATRAGTLAGTPWAFALAVAVVALWLVTGPLFGYSDKWQLFINTATTISTFLMVFLLQHAQNKDTRAVHLKLDELLAAHEGASNRLIDIEELTEDELEALHRRFQELHARTGSDRRGAAHSVEETSEPKEVEAR